MDMIKMGMFLSKLRKEKNLTQAQLGERIGLSNKTVSRWETGMYSPPVEMLEELSRLYGITINEILSGRKLTMEEYMEMAENNIRETLRGNKKDITEKELHFRKQWYRQHCFTLCICVISLIVLMASMYLQEIELYLGTTIVLLVMIIDILVIQNRCQEYIRTHISDCAWNH